MKYDQPFCQDYPRSYRIPSSKLYGDITVLEIGHNRVPPGLKQVLKRDVYILHYITNGKGVFLGKQFDKNYGYLVTPGQLEIIIADKQEPYEAYWIMFKGTEAAELLSKCGLPNKSSVFPFDKTMKCGEILKKALFEITPNNSFEEACILQSVFYRIMALHMQDRTDTLPDSAFTAKNVMTFIKENYHRQIKISELAQKNNFTRNYLYTLFKKEYNISPQEYLLSLRIDKAKLLLKDKTKELSVNEVAYAVGFNDPLYFSRIFRKKTGCSPTQFKNSY